MSADNTIAILETLSSEGSGREYRVIHAQAVENIFWKPDYPKDNPLLNREEVIRYFGDTNVLNSEVDAWREAFRIENDIKTRGKVVTIEYGIEHFDFSGIVFPSQ